MLPAVATGVADHGWEVSTVPLEGRAKQLVSLGDGVGARSYEFMSGAELVSAFDYAYFFITPIKFNSQAIIFAKELTAHVSFFNLP